MTLCHLTCPVVVSEDLLTITWHNSARDVCEHNKPIGLFLIIGFSVLLYVWVVEKHRCSVSAGLSDNIGKTFLFKPISLRYA